MSPMLSFEYFCRICISQTLEKGLLIILCFSLITLFIPAQAQQTIFDVPSADVTPKGKVFLQHESQFRPWKPNRFWTGTHYAALGIGHHTELDVTLFNVSAPATDNIALGVGFKSVIPVLEKLFPERELKVTVGTMVPISLQGDGVGNWSYATTSFRLPKTKTRFTAGVSTGTQQIFGRDTVGFIGGYEQPITKRFSLIGDWHSGTSAYGLFIPGFSYAVTNSMALYAGYQIPNNKRSGVSGFVIELAKFF